VSTPDGATVVEPKDGRNLTVSFVSRLPAEQWNETLAEEYNASPTDDRYVTNVTGESRGSGLYEVTLTFEQDATYRLRMAKVGVGNGVTEESTTYLMDIDGEGTSVQKGENATITLSTRDQFGNPVTAATVYADPAGRFADDQKQTDANGRVSFTYDSDGVSPGTQRLNFSLASFGGGFDQSTAEDVTVNVSVTSSGSGDGDGSVYDVNWQNPEGDNNNAYLSGCSASDCTWDVGADSDSSLTLRANTTPSIDGSNIDFAINNSTVGNVSPGNNSTNDGSATTTFTAKSNGTIGVYAASGGSSDVINITIDNTSGGTTNQPPNADAGGPYTVDERDTTTLDGSSSSDPDGDSLSYSWSITGTDYDATIQNPNSVSPTFDASGASVSQSRDVTVELEVSDGNGGSTVATTTVTIQNVESQPPTVDSFAPADGSTTNTTPDTITFDVSDSGSGVDLSTLEITLSDSAGSKLSNVGLGDPNVQESSGTVTIDLTSSNGQNIDLADGDVTTDVSVSDNAGNSGAGSATFTLDTTLPSPSIDQVTTSGGKGSSDVTVDWSVTDNIELSGGTVNEIRLVGDGTTVESITPTGTVDSGSVTFTGVNTNKVTEVVIEVTDGAGNSETDSEPVN
jgi:hypothetical protein